jgi:hypothetical protein
VYQLGPIVHPAFKAEETTRVFADLAAARAALKVAKERSAPLHQAVKSADDGTVLDAARHQWASRGMDAYYVMPDPNIVTEGMDGLPLGIVTLTVVGAGAGAQ